MKKGDFGVKKRVMRCVLPVLASLQMLLCLVFSCLTLHLLPLALDIFHNSEYLISEILFQQTGIYF